MQDMQKMDQEMEQIFAEQIAKAFQQMQASQSAITATNAEQTSQTPVAK